GRLSREELRGLHRRYRDSNDPAERDRIRARLVDAYHDFVYFLARKFQNRGEPLDDIVQVGYLGLIKAIERFDPDLGYEFTTFATLTVAGEIKRHFRDKGTAIRFPRRLQELHQSVVRVNEQMKNELGREPSVQELLRADVPVRDRSALGDQPDARVALAARSAGAAAQARAARGRHLLNAAARGGGPEGPSRPVESLVSRGERGRRSATGRGDA